MTNPTIQMCKPAYVHAHACMQAHKNWGHQTARLLRAIHYHSSVDKPANEMLNSRKRSQSGQKASFHFCIPLFHTNTQMLRCGLRVPLHSNRA